MSDAVLPLEQLARDLGVDPRDIVRDLGEREAAALAAAYQLVEAADTKKPEQRMPLKTRNGEFGTVGAVIPEALFFHKLAQGDRYGLRQMMDAQDLRPLIEEFPICAVETVSGRIFSGPSGKGRWGERKSRVKFDKTVQFAK